MKTNKHPKALASIEYDGFSGIDISKAFSGEGGIKELTDFRLRFDGALEKRGGFELFTTFTGNVRAVYQLSNTTVLLLVNDSVYLLYLSTGAAKFLSYVGTSSGEASFFSFNGSIYLIDGSKLYIMSNDVFYPIDGYVPLYGKDWHPLLGGQVFEPINLLSQRIRVSYDIPSAGMHRFLLPLYTKTIDNVTRNGVNDDISHYSLGEDHRSVYNDHVFNQGDVVEFFVTVSNVYIDAISVTKCRSAAVYGDGSAGSDKVFVAFYNGTNKNVIFPSSSVSDDQLEKCKSVYGNLSNIYICEENAISANDGKGNITGTCQKDNGLMVFTADRAFMLTTDENGKSHFVRVSLGTGCSSSRGAIIYDDTPITVSYYGIFKWDPLSYEEGEYRARCISRPVGELLDDEFFSTAIAYHYRKKGELWFCDPSDTKGMVLIYSIDSEAWYRFSGIGAEFFFEYNGELGFIKGNKAYIFSPTKITDTIEGEERRICAKFESGIISFDSFNEKKRLSRCIIRTSPGASVTLTVTDAEGRSDTYQLSDGSGERLGYIEKRLKLYRSRHYSISVETEKASRIYGITLTAVD